MAIDWKTIISEFDGKPTLLQAIGKLRKAVEDETITIQQAQAEIAKLESQQKADEALITTVQTTANEALDLATTNKANILDKVDKITGAGQYIRIYGVSKDGVQTIYEASETGDPWKLVRRDVSGSFDIPEATKNTQPVRKDTFDFKLSQKQDKIKDTTNLDARYISAVSAFRKVTLVGSTKTYSDINFENGREAGGDIYVLTRGNTKTLFGNKSLYGTGNIDLYRHTLTISGTFSSSIGNFNANEAPFKAVFISSNNLNCDSIADLKTVLGNEFYLPCMGAIFSSDLAHSYPVQYITSATLNLIYNGELSSISITGAIITDTVTTI